MMQKYKPTYFFKPQRLYFRLKKQRKNIIRRKKVNIFNLKTLGFFLSWSSFLKKNLFFFYKKKFIFFFLYKFPQPKPDFFFKNVIKSWADAQDFFFYNSLFFVTNEYTLNYQSLVFLKKLFFFKLFFFKLFFFKLFFFKLFFFKLFFFKNLLDKFTLNLFKVF